VVLGLLHRMWPQGPEGLSPLRRWGWVIAFGFLLAGCLREEPPPTDPELARQLGLAERTPIHRITLASREGRLRVMPGSRSVRPGDWVQFLAADQQIYAVRFQLEALDADQRIYLSTSAQEASPPLTVEGARFVVGFEGAPPGLYPFWVEGYGSTSEGVIRVEGSRR
jgi:hypothetical protein